MVAQTTAAALATYAVVEAAGMVEGTRAVIPAPFVVQRSGGGAGARGAGTALGALPGPACPADRRTDATRARP